MLELWFSHMGGILVGRYRMLGVLGLWWMAFAAAACCVVHLPRRGAMVAVVAGAAVFTSAAWVRGPQTSDDLYRYAWDGTVQAHGIDPYRYPPDDPHLAALRDPWLWPSPRTCAVLGKPVNCTRVNRSGDRTIYPPVAEAWFRVLRAVLPPGTRERGYQVAAGLVGLALTALLLAALSSAGRNPGWAVLWAWSPIGVAETAMDAHVDVLAVVAVVAALWALSRQRAALGGALLGVGIAIKLIPGLLLPAAVRRHPLRVAGSAAAVVALSYLPHVLAVGPEVLGYLPGYLQEENYSAGSRFLLLRLVGLDGGVAQVVAVAVLAGAAAAVALWREPAPVLTRARWMVLAAFLVATPVQPWYGEILVAVAVLDGAWELLAVAAAAYPLYFGTIVDVAAPGYGEASYGIAALVVVVAAWWRWRASRGAPPGTRRGRPPAGGRPLAEVGGAGS
ncbi:MAG: glycosyltransferase 87 family protein [Acidimicrobiales bacterium]